MDTRRTSEHPVVSRLRPVEESEIGAAARLRPDHVRAAAGLVRAGLIYDLTVDRFRGMPMPLMHPPFEVLGYRTPHGLDNDPRETWLKGPANREHMGFNTELVITCTHTGSHVDTLSHVTVGDDSHWYGGFTAANDLGDFGPQRADASTLLPIFPRGVMLDLPRAFGTAALAARAPIGAADLRRAAALEDVSLRAGDVALIRTGYLGHWPDAAALDAHRGAGITLEAAHWLVDQGVIAVGADTEAVEQMPTTDAANPQPVHSYLLIDQGVLLLEMLYLEGLAADSVHSFLFVAQPTKIQGASGAFIDPIAVV